MPIAERGYRHWDGGFRQGRLPWWPITRLGIRLAFKRKFFKPVFGLSLGPAIVFLVGIYMSERVADFQFMFRNRSGSRLLGVNPSYFKTYFTVEGTLFLMVMLMVLAGASLIADDMKFNALQLYFSRPLRKRDYWLGKMGILSFFLLLVTLVPGCLFILFKVIFSGSFKLLADFPWLPLSIAAFSILATLFFASYTLLISALSKNRRYTAILIFLIYIFSDMFFGIFYGIFHDPSFCLISIKCNIQQVGAFLFRVAPQYDVPWIYSFLILAAIGALSGIVLKRKMRAVEVIK